MLEKLGTSPGVSLTTMLVTTVIANYVCEETAPLFLEERHSSRLGVFCGDSNDAPINALAYKGVRNVGSAKMSYVYNSLKC